MSQLDVVIDREAVARHGINVGDVNDTIEIGHRRQGAPRR